MMRWERWALWGLALGVTACSSDPECTTAFGGDGVYDGYDYCSEASYPDFLSAEGRWDGTCCNQPSSGPASS